MDRIIDIETDDRHLHRLHGFMVVSEGKTEVGRVPLDDILAVIIHAHGVTYSNSLMVELARRGALVVLCSANHQPQAILWPLDGHHVQLAHSVAVSFETRKVALTLPKPPTALEFAGLGSA